MDDTETNFEDLALVLMEAGQDMDATLSGLKDAGATVADCLSALQAVGIDKKDAQKLVATSDAWRSLFQLARDNRR